MEPWLGVLHLVRRDAQAQKEFEAIAAVYCKDRQGYEAAAQGYAQSQGYQLLWAEDMHPAGQWITLYPKHRGAANLARAVHGGHLIELGPLRAVGAEGDDPKEAQSYLLIEEITNIEPLDMQLGAPERKTVPDALQVPLFGQPEPTKYEIIKYGTTEDVPSLNTYAILDAAKMPFLLTALLEDLGVRYQSLFNGQAEDELKECAPYLVELHAKSALTRKLFTVESAMGLWQKDLGIYLRSRASFETVRKRLRKFTRIQDENQKWYFFRFWEGCYMVDLARKIETVPYALFAQSDITAIFPNSHSNTAHFITKNPEANIPQIRTDTEKFILSDDILKVMSTTRANQVQSKLYTLIGEKYALSREIFDQDFTHLMGIGFRDESVIQKILDLWFQKKDNHKDQEIIYAELVSRPKYPDLVRWQRLLNQLRDRGVSYE